MRFNPNAKTAVICPTCQQSFLTYICHIRRGRGRYCSRRCSKLIKDKEAHFWSRVQKTDSCWLWTGGIDADGYGMATSTTGVSKRAHRLAWKFTHGRLPENMMVCHACDNPTCVRPDHLFLGTALDNATDRDRKGRYRQPCTLNRKRGEANHLAKLTATIVSKIRQRYTEGQSAPILAMAYNVSRQTIHRIVKRVNWKHID